MTHFPVTALRSVDLETPDIARSEQFYTSVWGLDLVTRHEGVTYLRASGADHHVVALPVESVLRSELSRSGSIPMRNSK